MSTRTPSQRARGSSAPKETIVENKRQTNPQFSGDVTAAPLSEKEKIQAELDSKLQTIRTEEDPLRGGPKNQQLIRAEEINLKEEMRKQFYKPFDRLDDMRTIDMPKNLFTAAIVGPLGGTLEEYSFKQGGYVTFDSILRTLKEIFIASSFFLALGVVLMTQGYFIFAMRQMSHVMRERNKNEQEGEGSCLEDVGWEMLSFCLLVFTVYLLGDFHESIMMIRWVRRMDRAPQWSALWLRDLDSGGQIIDSGLTTWWKIFSFLIILLKIFVAAGVLLFGGQFLLLSESREEALLNAVATCFVLEVDDIFYHVFVADPVRHLIDKLPPIILQDSVTYQTCIAMSATVLNALFVAVAARLIYIRTCGTMGV